MIFEKRQIIKITEQLTENNYILVSIKDLEVKFHPKTTLTFIRKKFKPLPNSNNELIFLVR